MKTFGLTRPVLRCGIALNFISARSLGLAVAADARCKLPLEKVPMTASVEPMNGG
jgi:hypothetical protein